MKTFSFWNTSTPTSLPAVSELAGSVALKIQSDACQVGVAAERALPYVSTTSAGCDVQSKPNKYTCNTWLPVRSNENDVSRVTLVDTPAMSDVYEASAVQNPIQALETTIFSATPGAP